jgi:hypothetical protein
VIRPRVGYQHFACPKCGHCETHQLDKVLWPICPCTGPTYYGLKDEEDNPMVLVVVREATAHDIAMAGLLTEREAEEVEARAKALSELTQLSQEPG